MYNCALNMNFQELNNLERSNETFKQFISCRINDTRVQFSEIKFVHNIYMGYQRIKCMYQQMCVFCAGKGS